MAKGSDAPKLLLMLLRLSNRQTRAIIVTANVYFESEHDRIEGDARAASLRPFARNLSEFV
jgi:hypothetical protein